LLYWLLLFLCNRSSSAGGNSLGKDSVWIVKEARCGVASQRRKAKEKMKRGRWHCGSDAAPFFFFFLSITYEK
jgi:hypothetical protein